MLAVLEGHLAGLDRIAVALGPLDESPAASGEVVDRLRSEQTQGLEVDDVEVGQEARLEPSAVVQAVGPGGVAGQLADQELQGELLALHPVAGPVGEDEGRHAGVGDDPAMGTAVGQAKQHVGVLHVLAEEVEVVGLVAAKGLVEELVPAVADEQVVHHLDGGDPGGLGEAGDAALAVGLVVRPLAKGEDAPEQAVQAGDLAADGRGGGGADQRRVLGQKGGADFRPGHGGDLVLQGEPFELGLPGRAGHEDMEVGGQAVQYACGTAGDLGADVHALLAGLLGDVEHLVALVGTRRGRHEGDGQAGLLHEALDPGPLVVVAEVVGDHLEDAVGQPLHGQAQGQHLVRAREGARNVDAVDVLVQQGPGGGEAQGAGGDAFPDNSGHLGDLAGVRLVVGVAAVAQDVGANRAVGHVDAHVDGPGLGLQGVEVFREGLPLPVDALGEGGAGDVLHPLHELDEEVLLARADRREADAAVAHDGGGHAVPAGGGHDGIPGGLAIVVGVDVHPAGGDDEPVGVDLAPGRALDLANGDDAVALDSDVPDDGRRARSVHDGSAPDDQVQHVLVSPSRASIPPVCSSE